MIMDMDKFNKYFAGELSPEEKEEFLDKILKNPEMKEEFFKAQNLVGLLDFSLERKEKRSSLRFKWMNTPIAVAVRYAAIIIVVFLSSWFASKYYHLNPLKNAYTQIEIPQGHRAHVLLEDGTGVWLNSGSKMKYPNAFIGSKRVVELDGEGYFDVHKDKSRPFIVKTSRFNVQALGTKFNVLNYSASTRSETTLLDGSVKVFKVNDDPHKVTYLKPNEQFIMDDGRVGIHKLREQDISLWKHAYFIFNNATFQTIIDKLSIYYNVKFIIRNEGALRITFTGTFRPDDNLEDILKAIKRESTFNFSMSSDRNIVYID